MSDTSIPSVPEIASALGNAVEEIAEALGAGDPLPKVNYTVTIEDGPDAHWALRSMHFAEALSEPYLVVLELVTEELSADTEQLLGANIELSIDRESIARTVCGIIHLVEYIGVVDDRLHVRIEVVPALYLLTQRVDTRLWQDASVPDVLKEVLEAAFADYEREIEWRLTATYDPREYVVQYHESDFDFVNRLLEVEGITYWFDHERGTGKEVMVIEDSNDNYVDVTTLDDNPELHIIVDKPEGAEVESLQFLDWTRELTPTAVYRRLFDWMTPIEPVEAVAPPDGDPDVDDRGLRREVYHHGRMIEDDPKPRTLRKLAHRTQRDKIPRGHGNVTGLCPGRKFSLIDHQRSDLDQEYLVRRVVHVADCPDVVRDDPGANLPRYQNRFECLVFDDQKPFRPPPITPKPRIYGPQTAIVTGPDGEEIHTDEHGRVKVRFDWDRVHALTDDTSMWIRVAHHWAGPGYGTFFVPRIGMEVVVEFIEGNPDRPLIIGCVYNGDNAISVGLPDNKTKSTIRTKSSPHSDGYNEMRFEDAAGHEEIFVHAQKDYNEVVENCHSTSVGADQSNTVSGNQTQTVKKDQTETVEGHQKMTVQKTRKTEITEDETNLYHASRSTTVEVNELLEVLGTTTIRSGDTMTVEAQKDFKQTVGGKSTVNVNAGAAGPGDSSTKCANNYTVEATTKIFLSQNAVSTITLAGGNADHATDGVFNVVSKGNVLIDSTSGQLAARGSTKVEITQGGGGISIEGGKVAIGSPSEITLTVGGNSIKIDTAGVTVSGSKIDVTATGVTTISGSIVKLN